jgi:hypothetical protein
MFYSAAQFFCALVIFLASTIWEPATVQASCADGKPQPRETCAYPTIGSTISNKTAKSDSLLISEIPAVARRLTQTCLQAEQAGGTASQECWQNAAVDARRFTHGVTGTAADEFRALAAVWADLAQRLQQERASIMAAAPEVSMIQPVSDSWKPQEFSSARASKPPRKRRIAAKPARQAQSDAREKPIRQTNTSSPRVRKAKLKTTLGKKRFALAWRKNININKKRARKRKPAAKANGLKCLFSPKSCKQ